MPFHLAIVAIQMSGCYIALRALEGLDSLQTLWKDIKHLHNDTHPPSNPKTQAHLRHHTTWRYMINMLTAQ